MACMTCMIWVNLTRKDQSARNTAPKRNCLDAIAVCHRLGLNVYIDLVMNHKAGADETEVFKVVEVDPNNRTEEIFGTNRSRLKAGPSLPSLDRGDTYSSMQWNYHHFNGTDFDNREGRNGIFRIADGGQAVE